MEKRRRTFQHRQMRKAWKGADMAQFCSYTNGQESENFVDCKLRWEWWSQLLVIVIMKKRNANANAPERAESYLANLTRRP